MPITIDFDRKENIIYSKAEGVINIDDVMSYFSSIAHLGLRKGYRVFADYSEASLKLSNDDVQKLADTRRAIQSTGDKHRIAVLAKDDLVFALARMYEMLLGEEQYNVMVFHSQEEAKQWLSV